MTGNAIAGWERMRRREMCGHCGLSRERSGYRGAPLSARAPALADARPDARQVRPAWNPPVHPDTDGAPHEVVRRHEPNLGEAAVLTVVAVVAHEEIMPGRHHRVEIDSYALRG